MPRSLFRQHLIESDIQFPYGVCLTDMNRDGRLDLVVGSIAEPLVVWYEAPDWKRHVISDSSTGNITLAAGDLTHTGSPDIVVGSGFHRGMQAYDGYIQWFESPGWESHRIDEAPFIHRLELVKTDADSSPLLVVCTIRGSEGEILDWHDPGALMCYHIPENPRDEVWPKRIIDRELYINHGLTVVDFDGDGRQDILIGARNGIIWYRPPDDPMTGDWQRTPLTTTEASEVYVTDLDGDGVNEIIAIEPWHGNELVWYKADGDIRRDGWQRLPIDDRLNRGHTVHAGDYDGDGKVEIIAGYNGEGTSLHLYRPVDLSGNKWEKEDIDSGGLGVGQLNVADLTGNARPDLIATGLFTGNIKWYENLS